MWQGSLVDSLWHHLIEIDPVQQAKTRRHQIMAMARYGRQSIGELEGMDVADLRAWYGELRELLANEKPEERITENG